MAMEERMESNTKGADSVNVGRRLRMLREERDISMRALARRSGLSANALSMIERGLTSPSVSTLSKLAAALEIPITAFFRQEPLREKIVFCKASQRIQQPFARGLIEDLGGEAFIGRVEAFVTALEGEASSGPHGMIHTGNEIVYCLNGTFEYQIGEQRFEMEPGDSLIFSAQLIHRWRNPGATTAQALTIISAFDESERPEEYHLASMITDSARWIELGEKSLANPDDAAGAASHKTYTEEK